ncbi:oxidoreductase [Lactobacillaceae bacterium Scapto_B20]
MKDKVALITGSTSGIGYQTAQLLTQRGYRVYGAGRDANKLAHLNQIRVNAIQMDLTDEQSLIEGVQQILDREGHIDVLVNNAGYGSYGPIETVSINEAKRQFDVNLFGVAQLTKLVLPTMRAQRNGRIINVSSMGGKFTSYMGGWYHATKYAIEAYSDALRMEVEPFGIQVSIVEPGLIKTNWSNLAADNLVKTAKNSAYANNANRAAEGLRLVYRNKRVSQPLVIAKSIIKAITKKHPKTRYLVGFGAKPLVLLHAILPTKLFDYLMIRFG